MTREESSPSELSWTQDADDLWTAITDDGTDWEIRDLGSDGPRRFAVTVARWDHADWWAATLDEAKRIVAEVEARGPIPEEERVVEKEFVTAPPGQEQLPYETDVQPPTGPCDCGSRETPVAVKPYPHTAEWWDDPSPYWRCPACGTYREDIDEWAYDVSREEFLQGVEQLDLPVTRRRPWWRRIWPFNR